MIRKATVEDIDAINELDKKFFNDSLGRDFLLNDLLNNAMANYFVAVIDKQIVGYIGSWVADNTTILNFCVDSDYQKQGIGTKLLQSVIDNGVGCLSLEVRVTNKNAIRFYELRGFKKAAIRQNYYKNGDDAILMIRE